MNLPIFRPAAAADIEDAYFWYESRRRGLGEEFLQTVDSVVAHICEHPHQAPVIHRDTRRILLRRFPYVIFYRIFDSNILVIACMHASRDPRRWQIRH